jgi:hypothetical protein
LASHKTRVIRVDTEIPVGLQFCQSNGRISEANS